MISKVIFIAALAKLSFASVSNGPVINKDFADPALMRNSDGTWYAYSTSSGSGLVPASRSSDFKSWSEPTNVLSRVGDWSDGCVQSMIGLIPMLTLCQ